MMVTMFGKTLVAVIDDEGLKRMEAGDPFTMPLRDIGLDSELELVIGRATDADMASFKDARSVLKHIARGYEKRPEDGFTPYKVEFGKEKHD
jgi:hypothetical protein